MTTCIYCEKEKPKENFSTEHIWPQSLGGETLPEFWQTNKVCGQCNNLSGLFVDGAFVKSWFGSAERSTDVLYAESKPPLKLVLPLYYLGRVENVPIEEGLVAEFWTMPCGAHIVHIRPDDKEELWGTYAGGDPRLANRRNRAGRVYVVLTSKKPFWIFTTLASAKSHFKKASRFVVNMEVPEGSVSFNEVDRNDESQARDMDTVQAIIDVAAKRQRLRNRVTVSADVGNRLLAKLGLAVGYQLLGKPFLETEYSKTLRTAFREANYEKRKKSLVRGSGYLGNSLGEALEQRLRFPGAWILLIWRTGGCLGCHVITPSGKTMSVLVCDDPSLVEKIDDVYDDGVIWLTLPALETGIGPLALPSYIGHQLGKQTLPMLTKLEEKRVDFDSLPPCQSIGDRLPLVKLRQAMAKCKIFQTILRIFRG